MRHCDPVMATGWHMVLGGAGLLALSLATDGPELGQRLSGFSAPDAAAMAYGSLLGGAAAYGIFFYNATRGSLTALSSLTFLTPMFAAVSGRAARRRARFAVPRGWGPPLKRAASAVSRKAARQPQS
jgi:drug/metabolite transporter (DMT)-like permease